MAINYDYDWWCYDKTIMLELNWFLRKISERATIARIGTPGDVVRYEPKNRYGVDEPGLGRDVEYFHPTITLDDRMCFIGTEIASSPMSEENRVCNTLISHFYGARGIHGILSGSPDGLVDFEKINSSAEYRDYLRMNIDDAIAAKRPIWGTTELHTSIMQAGRDYKRVVTDDPTLKFHPIHVAEWVASFIPNGWVQGLQSSSDMHAAYSVLKRMRGIGEYYGFHGAASTSVLPFLRYHHDQRFVSPGPGACATIKRIWPNAPRKLYAEAVYFMREQHDKIGLTTDVEFHPAFDNIDVPGGELFLYKQDGLKYYGTEVLCCQFGIYLDIRNDPIKSARRRVARDVAPSEKHRGIEGFFA